MRQDYSLLHRQDYSLLYGLEYSLIYIYNKVLCTDWNTISSKFKNCFLKLWIIYYINFYRFLEWNQELNVINYN